MIDNVERGRSGFCAVDGIWDGAPVTRTKEQAWDLFRFGRREDYVANKPFPGQQFPLHSLENFQRQFVPRWTSTSKPQMRGVGAALRKIGPCVMVCHSQGGYIGSNAAVQNADVVKGFISAEGSGWPEDEMITTETVGDRAWLLLLGDYISASERWTVAKAQTAGFGEKVRAMGGVAELVELPEVGFPGATHMFMMDEHSAEIAGWVGDWVRTNC